MARPPLRRSTRQAIRWAVLAANGRWPARRRRVLHIWSFFAGWITTELAGPFLVANLLETARAIRRGEARDAEGKAAVALRGAAAIGLASFVAEGIRAEDELGAALSPHLDAEDLAHRPRSVRAGAFVPLLYVGRGRRRRTRNVVFTPDGHPHRLRLDVYEPLQRAERRPAIVQIHGGAWVVGDKREQGIPLLNHLAHHGWVGFNVNYRLSPRVRAPEHLVDCKLAIAWVREHADEYGVDPNFIAVTGGSAGGHLCAMVALTGNDPEYQPGFESADTSVQAAVPFYGVYDLADREQLMPRGFRREFIEPILMGSRFDVDEGMAFERYSPRYRVHADAPPMFILHGEKDSLVPVESARDFAARMAETSSSAVVYGELGGAQHAFDIFPSPRTVRTIEYVERFLDGCRRGVIK